mmetsp:Transcript_76321/g.220527  ORF Transcript_76321/g.220527 Transcript_76321/m.220527 type:complete len:381 (-) Transcript_76321:112-1254(-)
MACKVVACAAPSLSHASDTLVCEQDEAQGRMGHLQGDAEALARALYGAIEAAAAGPEASASLPLPGPLAGREASDEMSRCLVEAVRCIDRAAEEATAEAEGTSARGWRLVEAMLAVDAPARLLAVMGCLGFEARKDAMRLFAALLHLALKVGAQVPLAAYFRSHPSVAPQLLQGSGCTELFAHCAEMLRRCSRCPELAEVMIMNGAVTRLIDLCGSPNFEISSEAFSSLRELLLAQAEVSEPFVYENFDGFCARYHTLLGQDQDYVVKRQALRLLGDVLLQPAFADVMLKYVANEQFLRIHMNLLLDRSKSIQFGAFHIFKVFVANPQKPHRVRTILQKNCRGLLRVMFRLQRVAGEDAALEADISAVRDLLEALQAQQR